MKRNILIFTFLYILLSLSIKAQQVSFKRISETDGLPHNGIFGILNDSKGFMWFATGEGLCKFDGYKFQIFKFSIDDPTSLSNDQIYDIIEDKNGDLWISTYSGLNKFDRKTATFSSFFVDTKIKTSTSTNFFLKTRIDKKGNIWCLVAEKGLFKFNSAHQKFEAFTFPDKIPGNSKNRNVQDFYLNASGNIWLTTSHLNHTLGVYYYDTQTKNIKSYIPDKKDPESLNSNGLTRILEDKKGNIWIGLYDGLEKLDPHTGKVVHYTTDHKNPPSIPSGKIEVLAEDDEGNIWLGTDNNGLIKLNTESDEFYHYKNDPKNKRSLSSNLIFSILNDKKGILWIGTDKGLNQLILKPKAFQNYLFVSEEDEISSTKQITDLYTDKNKMIWYCSQNGLYKYDGITKPELILPVSCKELVQDSSGKFWLIGDGLTSFNPFTKEAVKFPAGKSDFKSINTNNLWSLYIDSEDILWMGTGGGGLNALDLKTGKVKYYIHDPLNVNSISNNEVGPILRDNHELWIGPYKGGLNKIDLKSGTISRYNPDPKDPQSLSHDVVSAIHKDKKGRMWIGTYQGVNVLDEEEKKFRRIKQNDGLASENISVNGITEDKNGNIWVATSAGISRIHPETFAIRNYDSRDGFQKNPKATIFKNRDGIIYIFGQNGITAFHPEKIEDNALPPKIAITDFLIFNKSVTHGEGSSLSKEVSETKNINLTYKESSITFEFAALSYILPEKNQYAYMMEGFDDDWINAGTRRYTTYTNLPAGKTYSFKVKGSNHDGVWNETGTSIQLYIKPPFWQTWWFKAFLVISFMLSIYALYRLRTRQLHQQRKKLTLMVKERTEEVEAQNESLSMHASNLEIANRKIRLKNQKIIHQAKKLKAIDRLKSQFLTNISHEFRTPLTLIVNPLEEMIINSSANNDVKAQLSVMNRNAKRLLQLINQLLDLSKIESGSMPLQNTKQDLVQQLRAIAFSFNFLAQKHKINYLFNSEEKEIITSFDTEKFEQIIYNLISNAFKFTPDEGTISINVALLNNEDIEQKKSSQKKFIQIKINDTGIGISSEHLPKIFDRFYQAEHSTIRKSEGTGIGLSLTKELVELHGGSITVVSNEAQGSSFTILLPLIETDSEVIKPLPAQIIQNYSESHLNEEIELSSEAFNISDQDDVPLLLIVEDNDDLRHLIKRIFLPHFKVEEAENGLIGWEKAIEFLPDLIISDVMMPGKDGYALCQQLKNDVKTSHIPMILLTAKIDGEEAGLVIGADDYITKPFNAKSLLLKVKNLLESRKRLRELIRKELGNKPLEESSEIEGVNPQDQLFLEQALQISEKYLNDSDFDMETLYRELGMSRTLVYKKIKSLTGLSPNEYVRQIRLNKAAQLLLEGKYNITEVMFLVGFNHRSYFINCFKKHYGTSPSEYAAR